MMKKITRLDRATKVRDAILNKLVRIDHGWVKASGSSDRWIKGTVGRFGFFFRTPTSAPSYRAPLGSAPSYQAALVRQQHRTGGANLAYGLDVFDDTGKLMNLEWDSDQRNLVSFRSGGWDGEFLGELRNLPIS